MPHHHISSAIAGVLLGTLALAAPAAARQDASHDHAAHGSRLGVVQFSTSCAPAVQQDVNKGVALLHSFWFSAAITTFKSVLERDPTCVIAHWGVAMSWWGNPFAGSRPAPALQAGRDAIDQARKTGAGTPREKAYLDAADQLFRDVETQSNRTRVLAYEKAMAALASSYREDVEAQIFYALALAQAALPTDKTYANQLKAAAILEREFAAQPQHPGLAHYIIHSFDVPPLAPRALDAARRYAAIAPDAAHALHMPSHTFTRVGLWEESIATNLASAAAARKDNAPAEELHALDYQAYAYLQTAQDAAARRTVDVLPALAAKVNAGGPGNAAPPAAGHYAAAAIPARVALEREAWGEAAALQLRPSPTIWADAVTHFARALGAARSGRHADAAPDLERLRAIEATLRARNDEYWAEQVGIQLQAATAWLHLASGRSAEALAAMGEAAAREDATEKSAITPGPIKPARELLAEMLLAMKRPAEALTEFQRTLEKEPKRFRALYGAARAAHQAGHTREAGGYYAELLKVAGSADTPRPELAEARDYR